MRWLFALLLIPNLALASVGEIGKVKGSGAIERGDDSIAAVDGVGNIVDCLLTSLYMIRQMILVV